MYGYRQVAADASIAVAEDQHACGGFEFSVLKERESIDDVLNFWRVGEEKR